MTLETVLLIGIITSLVANIGLIVYIAFLRKSDIVDWFRSKSAIKKADKDNLAFTLQSKLASGNYKTVQGVFNTRTNDLTESRVIKSKNQDSEMEKIHDFNELAVYK